MTALLCASSASAQTGIFFDEYGAGLKATAMGQAFTAVADDYSAAYYNPAGLTQINGIVEATAGYIYGNPSVWARYPDYPSMNFHGQPSSRGAIIGLASSLDLEKIVRVFPWFKRFSLGMVFWANLPEFGQYYAGPSAIRPHFLRHDRNFQALSIAVSLGFEITQWLSVGAGIIPSMDSYSDQDVFQALNRMNDVVKGLRLSIHQTAKVVVVPVLGVLIKPPMERFRDKLALGATFRGRNETHHGKGIIRQHIGFEDENGAPLPVAIPYPDHFNMNLISFVPLQVTAGVVLRPVKGLSLAYDMTYKRYSSYHTYLELTPVPPWHDTYTHRVGVEYAFHPGFTSRFVRLIHRICLRAGYYFEPTPVEEFDPSPQIPNNNIFDSDQDVASAGLCITLKGKKRGEHDFQFFFQYHRFRDRSRYVYIDSIYALMNGLDKTGYLEVNTGGDVWALGGSYTLRF